MSCHKAIVVITGRTLCVLRVEDHLKISDVVVYNGDQIYEANSFVAVRHYHEDNRSMLT